MKRRTKVVALATSLLVGVSMIGVGFATWVISNNAEDSVGGNVTVEDINDDSLSSSDFSITEDSKNIVFGYKKVSEGVTNSWLSNSSSSDTEVLSFDLTLSISKNVDKIVIDFTPNSSDIWTDISTTKNYIRSTISLELTGTNNTYFDFADKESDKQKCETLASGTAATLNRNESGKAQEDSNLSLTLKVTFAWGTHFGSINPYEYYNKKTYSDIITDGYTWATNESDGNVKTDAGQNVEAHTDAYVSLKDFYNKVGDQTSSAKLTYTFKFTASHNSATTD